MARQSATPALTCGACATRGGRRPEAGLHSRLVIAFRMPEARAFGIHAAVAQHALQHGCISACGIARLLSRRAHGACCCQVPKQWKAKLELCRYRECLVCPDNDNPEASRDGLGMRSCAPRMPHLADQERTR